MQIRVKQLRNGKRPCTAFIKSNVARASSDSKHARRTKAGTPYKNRRLLVPGRPDTAPHYIQPCRHNEERKVYKGEKNLLWRQKEDAARQRRAEIYAINGLLQLKFHADFKISMKSPRV